MMRIRGLRGATVADANEAEAILSATRELLREMLAANPGLEPDDMASVFFTVTQDLDAVHPALAARQLGWGWVPLLCAQEIPVPGGMARCVRVLIHWNTCVAQSDIRHVYLREAANLRPDLNPVRDLADKLPIEMPSQTHNQEVTS